jgi:nitrous oxide reductase accessory protein NosL
MTKATMALFLVTILLAGCGPSDHETGPVTIDPVELESLST